MLDNQHLTCIFYPQKGYVLNSSMPQCVRSGVTL